MLKSYKTWNSYMKKSPYFLLCISNLLYFVIDDRCPLYVQLRSYHLTLNRYTDDYIGAVRNRERGLRKRLHERH